MSHREEEFGKIGNQEENLVEEDPKEDGL